MERIAQLQSLAILACNKVIRLDSFHPKQQADSTVVTKDVMIEVMTR